MWLRIRTLIIKELLAVWRNHQSRMILIAPPLIQMLVFSFAATQEITNVPIGILNRDRGTAARDLVARFQGSPNFARVRYLEDERDLVDAVDSRDALMVIHIQQDFSRDVAAGRPATIQLILDGRRSNAAQIVESYASAIVSAYNEELAEFRPHAAHPTSIVLGRVWFNPNQKSTWSTVPALVAILTTLMGLVVTALTVARERELGTFEQLLVSPLSPLEIIIGKTVPALLIGLLEATGMVLVGIFIFQVPFHGSLLLLYVSMTVYLFAIIGVGLFISALSKTQQQAILGAFVFMVPAMLLSGFASPIENMPDWLQTLTLANPVRYFITIVKGIFLKGLPASVVFQNTWPMAVISIVTLSSATWLFRHRME